MSRCKEQSCRKEIFWIKSNATGKHCPMSLKNGHLISHFLDCTNPERFSSGNIIETIAQKINRLEMEVEDCTECEKGLLGTVLCKKCIKINNKIEKLKQQHAEDNNSIE